MKKCRGKNASALIEEITSGGRNASSAEPYPRTEDRHTGSQRASR
jgi:hypothetical protein